MSAPLLTSQTRNFGEQSPTAARCLPSGERQNGPQWGNERGGGQTSLSATTSQRRVTELPSQISRRASASSATPWTDATEGQSRLRNFPVPASQSRNEVSSGHRVTSVLAS